MLDRHGLLEDSLTSCLHWRVWMFLGVQDIKTRFRRSLLGPAWILVNLGLFVGAAGFVYGVLFGQPMKEFLPFLVTGFVIWGFIVSTFTEAGSVFVGAEGYIKQFSFPKQVYLLRALVNYLIILVIGFFAVFPMQVFYGNFPVFGWFAALPGLVLLLAGGLAHITISAYLGTRFRDWPYALGGLLQVVFFLTPVMFTVKMLREKGLDFLYLYNPLYYLIDVVRHPILTGELAAPWIYAVAFVYVFVAWAVAIVIARLLDRRIVFLL